MPTIIAATDFSDVATNAIHYACKMAQTFNAGVLIVHSYLIPVTFNDTPMPVLPLDEGRKGAEESMAKLTTQMQTGYPTVEIASRITYGDITDSLEEITNEIRPLLIVVGNSSHEDTSFWLGSNLISTLKELPYPVVAVPETVTFKPINNICFACDYKQVTGNLPASILLDLVSHTNAKLHVLNIDNENKNFGTDTPLELEQLHNFFDPVKPQYHLANNPDVNEGIINFIEANDIDWLVIIPHRHSFFEGLFHKSHTKAIVKKVSIPIVALHERK